jgi:RNA polymerase sigma-70 factor (ECF subfamily)
MEECIPDSIGDAEVPEETLKTLMNDFLGTLSKDKRMIFVRHYWFGETISEISKRYGFSESKVKTTLHRTREKLRKFLEKKGVPR